jgi:xanthine/CO dehydrogenase XdhC/CoxF family maturation factor
MDAAILQQALQKRKLRALQILRLVWSAPTVWRISMTCRARVEVTARRHRGQLRALPTVTLC